VRAAALAAAWLCLVCAVLIVRVWALPLPARIGLCVAIATPGMAAIRRCLLLRGPPGGTYLDWGAGWRRRHRARPHRDPRHASALALSASARRFCSCWLQSRDGIHGVSSMEEGRIPGFPTACRQLQVAGCGKLIPSIPKV
jgi:hypothetical protein